MAITTNFTKYSTNIDYIYFCNISYLKIKVNCYVSIIIGNYFLIPLARISYCTYKRGILGKIQLDYLAIESTSAASWTVLLPIEELKALRTNWRRGRRGVQILGVGI